MNTRLTMILFVVGLLAPGCAKPKAELGLRKMPDGGYVLAIQDKGKLILVKMTEAFVIESGKVGSPAGGPLSTIYAPRRPHCECTVEACKPLCDPPDKSKDPTLVQQREAEILKWYTTKTLGNIDPIPDGMRGPGSGTPKP